MGNELERLRTELRSLASVRLDAHLSQEQARRYGHLCRRELELIGLSAKGTAPPRTRP
jgi:hypothetical protein